MKNANMYTTDQLFRIINNELKEKGLLPDHLDYALADDRAFVSVKTIEWDILGKVNFGCEGIYLDMYVEGIIDYPKESKQYSLGTYKTLRDDKAAYADMAQLMTEFVFALRKYVDDHMADFNWIGWDVKIYSGDEKKIGYTGFCGSRTEAEQWAEKKLISLLSWNPNLTHAILVDNETGEEYRVDMPEQE